MDKSSTQIKEAFSLFILFNTSIINGVLGMKMWIYHRGDPCSLVHSFFCNRKREKPSALGLCLLPNSELFYIIYEACGAAVGCTH